MVAEADTMRSYIAVALLLFPSLAVAQIPSPAPKRVAAAATLPTFEVATIKPAASAVIGFHSQPGGRVFLANAPVTMIIGYAFDLQSFQISGGPAWASKERYDITAVPPDASPSRTAAQPPLAATPTTEQRQMLQALLRDRFGFKYHWEKHDQPVYILTRGTKPLQLKPPEHPDADSRGNVVMKQGGVADGEAFGENLTMAFVARMLSADLKTPVVDQTGISGHYDFHLDPFDADNRDYDAAVFGAIDRLGLKLTRSTAPIDTLVIDHVDPPSAN